MYLSRTFIALTLVTFAFSNVSAEGQGLLERIGLKEATSSLDEKVVADGLREALTVGVERAVKHVSKSDGYLKNKKISIPMPKPMRRVERPIRRMGHGAALDEFVLSMNRAAEAAAPLAQQAFVDAIAGMSMEDARRVWKGSDTAATEYLSENTRESLVKAFTPHVRKTMNQYAVTEKYNAVLEQYSSSIFARKFVGSSIEEYTAEKSLDGLFYVLGEEEKKIRTQPVARSTDLLKKVFGQ